MFFSRATDKTVFITSTGNTPSAAVGKLESPIFFVLKKKKEKLTWDYAEMAEKEWSFC